MIHSTINTTKYWSSLWAWYHYWMRPQQIWMCDSNEYLMILVNSQQRRATSLRESNNQNSRSQSSPLMSLFLERRISVKPNNLPLTLMWLSPSSYQWTQMWVILAPLGTERITLILGKEYPNKCNHNLYLRQSKWKRKFLRVDQLKNHINEFLNFIK